VEAADFDPALRGPWRKFESYALRVALILHELWLATGAIVGEEIAAIDIEGAVKFVTWAKSHARRVYAYLGNTPADHRALDAIVWIERHGGSVTVRDFLRHKVAGVKRATQARAFLRDLNDRGYGQFKDGRSPQFTLWPQESERGAKGYG